MTTKHLHTRSIFHELLWFLKGETNIKYLKDNGVSIWDAWADSNGNLGPIYGKQWRRFEGILTNPVVRGGVDDKGTTLRITVEVDQIKSVLKQLKENPDSRRMLVSAWNPVEMSTMALPPCHVMFQFYTKKIPLKMRKKYAQDANCYDLSKEDEKKYGESGIHSYLSEKGIPERYLSCQLYQRSADVPIGVPFNIASYALLVCMMAHVCNMVPDEFVHTLGDAHIYLNQIEGVKEQLTRTPHALPKLVIKRKVESIDDFKFEDFEIVDYVSHPHIKMPVAV